MPEIPPQDDPVVSRPMSVLILVSVFLLLLTVAWSLYGEFFGLRPWRDYQAHFRDLYSSYLRKQISQRRTQEQAFYASADYKKLKAAVDAAGAAALPEDRKIQAQIDVLDRQRGPRLAGRARRAGDTGGGHEASTCSMESVTRLTPITSEAMASAGNSVSHQ